MPLMYVLPDVPTITHYSCTYYQIDGASRAFVSLYGQIYSSAKGRHLSARPCRLGYIRVPISFDDGKKRLCSMHRLVAMRFIPNIEGKPDVNHVDGIKANNHVSNLEWVTKSENTRHAFATGLMKAKRGAEHPMFGRCGAPVSNETRSKMAAAKIGERHPKFTGWYITPVGTFASAKAAADILGTSYQTVIKKCKGGKMIAQGWDFEPAQQAPAMAQAA